MEYHVKLTNHAIEQMRETVGYISKALLAPDVAHQWVARMEKELASLAVMPGRYSLTEEEPWRSEGIHKFSVENFIVYYWIEEAARTVWITAIVYGRRDQTNALRNMPAVE